MQLSKECGTSESRIYNLCLIFPLLFVWSALIPGIIFYVLFTNRGRLRTRILILRRFGYFFVNYKDSAYYWEFVKIIKRVLIVAAISFFKNDVL